MRPSARTVLTFCGLAILAILLWCARIFSTTPELDATLSLFGNGLIAILALFVLILIFDGFLVSIKSKLEVKRILSGGFAQGIDNTYQIQVKNLGNWKTAIQITDGLPQSFSLQQTTVNVEVAADQTFTHAFTVTPRERGDFEITPAWILVASKFGLWEKRRRQGGVTAVQVYPNFALLANGLNLGTDQQIQRIGIHQLQRRGEGMDFQQLRNFYYGDSPNQVDWKASARMRKLIAREYQDERDQSIYFLLDCGHRMRSIDQGYSYFDHAINALLITAFIALKQGDAVGLVSFAGEQKWIPPVKGEAGIKYLLNQTYNLQSTTDTSDYLQLASQFMEKHPKRSLVVLITSLHVDDYKDLTTTITLLRKKHIVMVVSIAESFLEFVQQQPIHTSEDAKQYAGVMAYAYAGEQLITRLRSAGVIAASTQVTELSHTLTSEYIRLKKAGQI